MGLKITACLGHNVDAEVLNKATKEGEVEEDFLEKCVEFGFLQNYGGAKKYRWAHDVSTLASLCVPFKDSFSPIHLNTDLFSLLQQIQQAAYDLIPPAKRDSFHLLLGSRLFISTPPSEMKQMIFFIVDNMNRGSEYIDELDQKYEVAQLNLDAGEKALSASAFESASRYILAGLSLLGPDSWEVNYKLSIKLYDAGKLSAGGLVSFQLLPALFSPTILLHIKLPPR